MKAWLCLSGNYVACCCYLLDLRVKTRQLVTQFLLWCVVKRWRELVSNHLLHALGGCNILSKHLVLIFTPSLRVFRNAWRHESTVVPFSSPHSLRHFLHCNHSSSSYLPWSIWMLINCVGRNLSFETDEDHLSTFMSQFGDTVYCRMVIDPTSERCKGSFFICGIPLL